MVTLDPTDRAQLLAKLEQVWAAPARADALSYLSAMLRCEALVFDDTQDFANAIAAGLLELMKTALAPDSSEISRLTDILASEAEKAGRVAEANAQRLHRRGKAEPQGWNVDDLHNQFLDARKDTITQSGPLGVAAFVDLSRQQSPSEARDRFTSLLSNACVLNWTITTWLVVNGVKMPPPTVTHATTSCF